MSLNRYPATFPPTPLIPIRLSSNAPVIWCKLEFLNPSGSTKDRIARFILGNAIRDGRVKLGGTVIEASSGSTSIAMALTCAQLGLHFIAVLPDGVSNERVLMIRAYGGEVRFTARERGLAGSIAESEVLAKQLGAFLPRQFENPENADAHRTGTAAEILEQIPSGRVDAVVSGVGTGGTLVGLARGCAGTNPNLRAYVARPVNLHHGAPEPECCSFSCRIPGVMDCMSGLFRDFDFPGVETIEVDDDDAIAATRALIGLGFPVGPSSGLNYHAAVLAAGREGSGVVVTVLPDRMERYFSTELFRPFREQRQAAPAAVR